MQYNRINLDGKSITATKVAAVALLPGTFVYINGDEKFAQATAPRGRMYVVNPGYHQGLNVDEPIPVGSSAVADYVEEARELAVLVPTGTYEKDSPIKLGTSGLGALASNDADSVIGYSQDTVVIPAGVTDLIRVRFRVGT